MWTIGLESNVLSIAMTLAQMWHTQVRCMRAVGDRKYTEQLWFNLRMSAAFDAQPCLTKRNATRSVYFEADTMIVGLVQFGNGIINAFYLGPPFFMFITFVAISVSKKRVWEECCFPV